MTRTVSAAIFYPNNMVLVEGGDTIADIARSVVEDYDLADNVGACTKAMVHDYYGVSWNTYRKNTKKYDRTFREGQVYELPAACTTKFHSVGVTNTIVVAPTSQPQPVIATPTETEVAVLPAMEFPTHYSLPPLVVPQVDDDGYRNNPAPQVYACANGIIENPVWMHGLPPEVYETCGEIMVGLALKVCRVDRLANKSTQSSLHNDA